MKIYRFYPIKPIINQENRVKSLKKTLYNKWSRKVEYRTLKGVIEGPAWRKGEAMSINYRVTF